MFSWLARLLGWPTKEELSGASLALDAYWELSAPADAAAFVRRLPELLPEGTVLYLEGASMAREVSDFLDARRSPTELKIARGTILPRPKVYHLPMTEPNTAGLAELFEAHASPEICDHFHAYVGGGVLLQWHDAFFDDPLLLSPTIPEEKVKRFCNALGCTCKWSTPPG
jgi:hypothetical protein